MTKPMTILHRLLAVTLAANLALSLTAQTGNSLFPVAGANQALKEAKAALATCDFVRVRAQVGLAHGEIGRAEDAGEIGRSIAAEAGAVQKEADQKEQLTTSHKNEIQKLIEEKHWKDAHTHLVTAKADSCPQLFEGFEAIIAANLPVKKAAPLGPSAGQRVGSGIKWMLIVGAIAGAGYVAWDQYRKRQPQTGVSEIR